MQPEEKAEQPGEGHCRLQGGSTSEAFTQQHGLTRKASRHARHCGPLSKALTASHVFCSAFSTNPGPHAAHLHTPSAEKEAQLGTSQAVHALGAVK